ncbi:DUF6682 family protein [Caballeronia sp. TF1N1]|uniref:phage adaptor protein n=1 Tax=Caballeronia sp. TF1N1 TaxID=2878153 RepID=UPI001FD43520|nr:DUF6682 family protein [Caballeronia sp. TF1N1]
MNINQLFQDLSFGELSTLSLAQDGNGYITDAGKERLIRFANDGMLKLYGRFVLKESELLIEQVEWITNYHLILKFAESQMATGDQDYYYIKDLPAEPFKDDVIRILKVYDVSGCELKLNDDANPFSLFTPQANVLQVPNPVGGAPLAVTYQAKPAPLVLNEALDQEIELPDVLHAALRNWIAYRCFGQVKTQESMAAAADHLAQFEGACAEVITYDLVGNTTSQTNNRFALNGWA